MMPELGYTDDRTKIPEKESEEVDIDGFGQLTLWKIYVAFERKQADLSSSATVSQSFSQEPALASFSSISAGSLPEASPLPEVNLLQNIHLPGLPPIQNYIFSEDSIVFAGQSFLQQPDDVLPELLPQGINFVDDPHEIDPNLEAVPDNAIPIQYQQIPPIQDDIEPIPDSQTAEEIEKFKIEYVEKTFLKNRLLESWTPIGEYDGQNPHGRLNVPRFMRTFRQLSGIPVEPKTQEKRGKGRPRKVLAPGEPAPRPNFNKNWSSKHDYPNGRWEIEDVIAFLKDVEQVMTVQPRIKIHISENVALRVLCRAKGAVFPWVVQEDDLIVILNGGYIRTHSGVWDGWNFDATYSCCPATCDSKMLVQMSQKRGIQGNWRETPKWRGIYRTSVQREDFRDVVYQLYMKRLPDSDSAATYAEQ
ncbi:hypothetical protein TWF694_011699 [Orbilia ellipsospora]|uniref:Uncharacterized protein n=1 Tax=Orbilia ellipsospora TaxID=2528407 RepID=A0AAV9X7D3_9PEZI